MDFSAFTALLLCALVGGIFFAPLTGRARKH